MLSQPTSSCDTMPDKPVTVIDRTIEFLRTGVGDTLDLLRGLVVVREELSEKIRRPPVLDGTLIETHFDFHVESDSEAGT